MSVNEDIKFIPSLPSSLNVFLFLKDSYYRKKAAFKFVNI